MLSSNLLERAFKAGLFPGLGSSDLARVLHVSVSVPTSSGYNFAIFPSIIGHPFSWLMECWSEWNFPGWIPFICVE